MNSARIVLLTGSTGVVGSEVLSALLSESGTRIRLVVRASSSAHAEQRIAEVLEFLGHRPDAQRLEVEAGDVSLPRLGLSPDVYDRWTGEITNIIHSAGNVRLNRSIEEARRDALVPAEHILGMAQRGRARGVFQKLDYVSTIGVCGRWTGAVPEEPLPSGRDFHNTYEQAKAEAEDLLQSQMRAGFPATVHRPSMVVGNAQTGRVIDYQVFYHLIEFLMGTRTMGILPHAGDLQLDIVPVDYVAAAIVLSSCTHEAAGRTFHLCSGPGRSPFLRDLPEQLRAFPNGPSELPRIRWVSQRWFELAPRLAPVLPRRFARPLKGVPFLLHYLREVSQFTTHQTEAFFNARGLSLPAMSDLLPAVVDRYFRDRAGRRHRRRQDAA